MPRTVIRWEVHMLPMKSGPPSQVVARDVVCGAQGGSTEFTLSRARFTGISPCRSTKPSRPGDCRQGCDKSFSSTPHSVHRCPRLGFSCNSLGPWRLLWASGSGFWAVAPCSRSGFLHLTQNRSESVRSWVQLPHVAGIFRVLDQDTG